MKKPNKRNIEDILALTPVQEGMLYHHLKALGSDDYFEQLSLNISGPIDIRVFEQAWNSVVASNEMLRVVFRWEKLRSPTQLVLKHHPPTIKYLDKPKDVAKSDENQWLEEVRTADRQKKFALLDVPFRITLCTHAPQRHEMIVSSHHILYDGWSTGIILKEFIGAYRSFSANQAPEKPNKGKFKEFIRYIKNRDKDAEKNFWQHFLDTVDARTPLSIKEKSVHDGQAQSHRFVLEQDLTQQAEQVIGRHHITLAALIFGAWGLLLGNYNHSGEALFGTTVSGRNAGINGIENIVGLFINTLPLPIRLNHSDTAMELCIRVNNALREREEYATTGLMDINDYFGIDGSEELFDTVLVIENYPLHQLLKDNQKNGGPSMFSYTMEEQTHYDLTVGITTGAELEIEFAWKEGVFGRKAMEQMGSRYLALLRGLILKPEEKLSRLEFVSQAEKEQILDQFNSTGRDYPAGACIHQLFEAQVNRTPDKRAVFGTGFEKSYRRLNAEADGLAALLRSKGVGPGQVVGLMAYPQVTTLQGILAILKAGAAWLPISPEHPGERLNYILNDSAACWLLTPEPLQTPVPQTCEILRMTPAAFEETGTGQEEVPGSTDTDPAYIIYTSGSTGLPKGVVVPHSSFVNRLYYLREQCRFSNDDVVLQKAFQTFDVSVCEWFRGLVWGAATAVADQDLEKDMERLLNAIKTWRITVIEFVPPMLDIFLDVLEAPGNLERVSSLRLVFVGGEAVHSPVVKRFKQVLHPISGARLINAYGPTEATVDMTWYDCTAGEIPEGIPIGTPIDNTSIYILTPYRHLQPVGLIGELYIGGAALALGYLNRPELTAERFGSSPSFLPSPLYQTGDLAKWLPDGNIDFLGRKDFQVKVRGFRIELGEIENQLATHPDISETAVKAWKDEGGSYYLAAYYISLRAAPVTPSNLKTFLEERLPSYMVPAHFIALEHLPLTSNGKVDGSKLPVPEHRAQQEYSPPRTLIENQLVELWSELLGLPAETIGINDNFFERGGHSLRATALMGRIHKTLDVLVPLDTLFQTPTIRALSSYIADTGDERFHSIEAAELKEYYPLSPAQKRLFVLHQIDGGTAYNITGLLLLQGPLEKDKLQCTFRQLIQRHESLRTSFGIINDEAVQQVHSQVPFTIEEITPSIKIDTGSMPGPEDIQRMTGGFSRPFDTRTPPLLRVGLLRLEQEQHLLMLDMHHIISDGTSLEVMVHDFSKLFTGGPLKELSIQYRDYARWQGLGQYKETLAQQARYWQELFSGEIPVLHLPCDRPWPAEQDFMGRTLHFEIQAEETRLLNSFVLQHNVTLSMVLLATFNVMLAKLGNWESIVVGMPAAGRRHPDLEPLVGIFVNTLALLNHPHPSQTFNEFLQSVGKRSLEAYENQEYPFEELVDSLALERQVARNPLFDVMFALQNMDSREFQLEGLRVTPLNYERTSAKFALYLEGTEVDDMLKFSLEYSLQLFDEKTVYRFIDYFLRILRSALKNPGRPLEEFQLMGEDEKRAIMELSRGESSQASRDDTIHVLFEQRLPSFAGKTALFFQDQKLTYDTLNSRANQLARCLRVHGVKADTLVAVSIERSFEMIIAILAVLKAGGAYLPIDPEYPEQRKQVMLEDSGVQLLLSSAAPPLPSAGDNLEIIDVRNESLFSGDSSNLPYSGEGSHLLYVIYTSGSTGKPKGVMLEHHNLTNLIRFQENYTNIDFSSVLQFTTISFDVSFQEIFSTLLFGGTLYLITEELRKNVHTLFNFVGKQHIKTLFLPASFLKFLLNEQEYIERFPGTIRHIVAAGEQLVVNDLFRNWLKRHGVWLHNHYGPSESHVVTTLALAPTQTIPGRPSIGRPVSNTGIYIVDHRLNPQPPGVQGELLISGIQVGRGYLGQEQLTAEKFVENPFSPGERLYQTGDLARWLPDGNIEFLGRSDHQIKIRGFRIEPGEIESHLINHDSVKEAVVIDFDTASGEKALCAYITPYSPRNIDAGKETPVTRLREYLAGKLPNYMVPSSFMILDAIPLTSNKKVNRRILPVPEMQAAEKDRRPPRTEDEKALTILWADILNLAPDGFGIDDNFFHLGGHSLKATLMVSKLHKRMNIDVPLKQVFKTPTIRGLAAYIKGAAPGKFRAIPAAENREYYPLSSTQKRLYLLQQIEGIGATYNLWGAFRLQGSLNLSRMEDVFRQIIHRHQSFRTSFMLMRGEVAQIIHDRLDFSIEKLKLRQDSHLPKANLLQRTVTGFIRPFCLDTPPLLRVGIVESGSIAKKPGEEHILVIDMHHIISDGLSLGILVREFMALYSGESLPMPVLQYKDFSQWQNREKARGSLKKQEAYWSGRFTGELPILELPLDYPRPTRRDFDGHTLSTQLEEEYTQHLDAFASQHGLTLFMILLAGFNILLSRVTGQEDIVIGSPVAGRRHAQLDGIIGMFVNTLPHRNYPLGDKPLRSFLKNIKENTLEALENQDYLYEDLVEKIDVQREPGRNPVFDTMLTLLDVDIPPVQIPGLTLTPYPSEDNGSKFDLSLLAEVQHERLLLHFEYGTRLFKVETVQGFAQYLKRILCQLPSRLEQPIGDMALLSTEEKLQLIHEFNRTASDYPREKTIQYLFEEQSTRCPDLVALNSQSPGARDEYDSLTYRQLKIISDALSGQLAQKGVGAGSIVAILGRRTPEMVAGILSILKIGGIYLPIDADYPTERQQYLISDSKAELLLVTRPPTSPTQPLPSGIPTLVLSLPHTSGMTPASFDGPVTGPESPAYIMYTSGSTGIPKGVLVKHRNVVRLVKNTDYVPLNNETRILQTGAPVFDAATLEIWGPLLNGGQLALVSRETILDAVQLGSVLRKRHINTLWLSSPLFNRLMQQDIEIFTPLRYLLVGGDVLSPRHINAVRHRFPQLRVINGYGPTENTTFSTTHPVTEDHSHNIPIGRPIANSTAYIVNPRGRLQPTGAMGELWVGGDGIALGYLNAPELTAERFVSGQSLLSECELSTIKCPGPSCLPQGPFYRTGDLVRRLADGTIHFHGRTDQQVKIRGFRVEMGEIENILERMEEIEQAVVRAFDSEEGEKYLCAYVVPCRVPGSKPETRFAFAPKATRDYLAGKLPQYMIPSHFVALEKIILNPNGKVDLSKLPQPGTEAIPDTYAPPENETQAKLAAIWEKELRVSPIGIHDDFFQVGGHSLKGIGIVNKIHKILGVRVSIRELFLHSTVKALAARIRKSEASAFQEIRKQPEKLHYELSYTQKRLWVLYKTHPRATVFNMPGSVTLDESISEESFQTIVAQLVERHQSLRTLFKENPQGPVQIIRLPSPGAYLCRIIDWTEMDTKELDERHRLLMDDETSHVFDLKTGPLFRAILVKMALNKNRILFNMHHIISDGWSLNNLKFEFKQLLDAHKKGVPPQLPPLLLQYRDYAEWQSQLLKDKTELQKAAEFWEAQLGGNLAPLKLPFDTSTSLEDKESFGYRIFLSQEMKHQLKDFARQHRASLFMVMLAGFNLMLSHITGQKDILIAIPTAARPHEDLKPIIGMFVNTLLLRTNVSTEQTFPEFFNRLKDNTFNVLEFQDFPLELICGKLSIPYPEINVFFNMRNMRDSYFDILENVRVGHLGKVQEAKFDLVFYVEEFKNGIEVECDYFKKRFEPGSIEKFMNLFIKKLEAIMIEPGKKLREYRPSQGKRKLKKGPRR